MIYLIERDMDLYTTFLWQFFAHNVCTLHPVQYYLTKYFVTIDLYFIFSSQYWPQLSVLGCVQLFTEFYFILYLYYFQILLFTYSYMKWTIIWGNTILSSSLGPKRNFWPVLFTFCNKIDIALNSMVHNMGNFLLKNLIFRKSTIHCPVSL